MLKTIKFPTEQKTWTDFVRKKKLIFPKMNLIDISDLNELAAQLNEQTANDPEFLTKICPLEPEEIITKCKGNFYFILDQLANRILARCLILQNRLCEGKDEAWEKEIIDWSLKFLKCDRMYPKGLGATDLWDFKTNEEQCDKLHEGDPELVERVKDLPWIDWSKIKKPAPEPKLKNPSIRNFPKFEPEIEIIINEPPELSPTTNQENFSATVPLKQPPNSFDPEQYLAQFRARLSGGDQEHEEEVKKTKWQNDYEFALRRTNESPAETLNTSSPTQPAIQIPTVIEPTREERKATREKRHREARERDQKKEKEKREQIPTEQPKPNENFSPNFEENHENNPLENNQEPNNNNENENGESSEKNASWWNIPFPDIFPDWLSPILGLIVLLIVIYLLVKIVGKIFKKLFD